MLTYILIAAIAFCIFQIILQSRKMSKIGKQFEETELQQKKEK